MGKYNPNKFVFTFELNGRRKQKTIYARDGLTAGRLLKRKYPKAIKLRMA